MFRSGIIAVLLSVMTCFLGFTMDRSAIALSTRDMAPFLDPYRKIFIDRTLNNKMQVTDMDNIPQAADAKVPIKLIEKMPENQTYEKRLTVENVGAGTKLVNDITIKNDTFEYAKKNISALTAPRNAVLLLIDERHQDEKKEEDTWKDYKEKLSFASAGSLQSCGDKIENSFSLDSALISENKEKDCDCRRILRLNIEELLSWARYTKGMTTGAVSDSNFSIPFFPSYEFDGSNGSNAKLKLSKSKRNSNDAWQMIDLNDRAKSISVTENPNTEEVTNYESTWDLFDVFSKIRMAFFRSLLESLGRNDGASEDKFSSHSPFSLKPTVTNLIGNTIKELKSTPNNEGYMLIAAVPRSERAAAVDLVHREISPKDTLLVITQICTQDKKAILFVAQGPNNQLLREARAISELPIAIRKAITNDCRSSECTSRQRRDVPIISPVPIEIFSQELPALKRVIRDKDVAEKPDTVSNEETPIIEKEKQARSSTSLQAIPYDPTIMLGVVTSVFVMAALTAF